MVVCGGFSPKISRKRSCDPLFNQSENQIHYEISFLMRLLICPFPIKEHTSKELWLKRSQLDLDSVIHKKVTKVIIRSR